MARRETALSCLAGSASSRRAPAEPGPAFALPCRAAGTAGSAGDESVPVVEKRPPHVSKLVARQNGPSLEIVIPPARWK